MSSSSHLNSEENRKLLKDGTSSSSSPGLMGNRYLLLIAVGLCLALNSRYYAGWPGFSSMLIKAGNFSWMCSPDETFVDDRGLTVCDAQLAQVGQVYILWSGSELVGSVVAGLSMDILGPKICATLGSILALVALLLVNLNSEAMPVMSLAAILGGISINVTSYPAMVLVDAFPANAAVCTAFIIASQSSSSLLPAVLNGIWSAAPSLTFNDLWKYYGFIVMIPIYILYVLAIPLKRAELKDETKEVELVATASASAVESAEQPIVDIGENSLLKALLTVEVLCIVILNTALMTFANFFQLILLGMTGPSAESFLGLVIPLAGPSGLPLGKLCDLITTAPMLLIQLVSFAIIYLGLLVGNGPFQYFTVTFYVITLGFSFTAKFTYICENFPSSIQPRLVGIVAALGGTSMIALKLMQSTLYAELWCCIVPAISLSLIPLVLFMWHRQSIKTLKQE